MDFAHIEIQLTGGSHMHTSLFDIILLVYFLVCPSHALWVLWEGWSCLSWVLLHPKGLTECLAHGSFSLNTCEEWVYETGCFCLPSTTRFALFSITVLSSPLENIVSSFPQVFFTLFPLPRVFSFLLHPCCLPDLSDFTLRTTSLVNLALISQARTNDLHTLSWNCFPFLLWIYLSF